MKHVYFHIPFLAIGINQGSSNVPNPFVKMRSLIVSNLKKVLALRASPHQIALGFSIGVFIGIFPTFGFGGIVILAIAALWKFNVPAAILGTLAGNPLFATIWITLACLITDISPSMIKMPKEPFADIVAHYSKIGLRYIVGNAVISLAFAVLSYILIVNLVGWYRKRKEAKSCKESDLEEKK